MNLRNPQTSRPNLSLVLLTVSSSSDFYLIELSVALVSGFSAVSSSFGLSVHHASSLNKGTLLFFSVSKVLTIPGAHVETRRALWESVMFDVLTDGTVT